jgi:hypothetical protein
MHWSIKSRASAVQLGKSSIKFVCLVGGILSSIVAANGLLIDSTSSTEGLPVNPIIFSSWFIVEFPGKIGRFDSISPFRQEPKMRGERKEGKEREVIEGRKEERKEAVFCFVLLV